MCVLVSAVLTANLRMDFWSDLGCQYRDVHVNVCVIYVGPLSFQISRAF